MPNVNFAMYSFSNLLEKCRKKSVNSRSKNEMEYAIIFLFHEEKWFVAESTVLENVIKMETTEFMHLQTRKQPVKCQKTTRQLLKELELLWKTNEAACPGLNENRMLEVCPASRTPLQGSAEHRAHGLH